MCALVCSTGGEAAGWLGWFLNAVCSCVFVYNNRARARAPCFFRTPRNRSNNHVRVCGYARTFVWRNSSAAGRAAAAFCCHSRLRISAREKMNERTHIIIEHLTLAVDLITEWNARRRAVPQTRYSREIPHIAQIRANALNFVCVCVIMQIFACCCLNQRNYFAQNVR